MSSCDNTVLTGQEGLIQFKPLGTTNCVDDYCPFMGTRIYLPCAADYDVDDCIEVERVKIPAGEGISDDGGTTVIEDGDTYYVVNDGKGVAGDVDACGNDMEGVPYIEVSATQGGTAISWDTSMAGEALESGVLTGTNVAVTSQGDGYNGGSAGTVSGVEVINGSGSGAVVELTVGALGAVTGFTVITGGKGYQAGDTINFEAENGAGTDASFTLTADHLISVRGNSNEGSYTFRLCDFQTVCGVRSFSIDLSRDELDVTTLPCSVSEACGKELASFRKTQAGFATATGTLEVYFTCDNESIQNKILQGSLQRTQGGATVRLYVCTKTDAQGEIDVDSSLFIEADIQLLGMSFAVDPDSTRPQRRLTSALRQLCLPSVFPDHWYGIAYALAYAGAFLSHYDSYVIGVINGWSYTLHRQAEKSCPS